MKTETITLIAAIISLITAITSLIQAIKCKRKTQQLNAEVVDLRNIIQNNSVVNSGISGNTGSTIIGNISK